ncbi:putative 3-oxoacyl-reductase [Hyaloraphidium curvatum]|nr:putative 3-oxoacyl-reductase [Hyaloraphidium curvatum]
MASPAAGEVALIVGTGPGLSASLARLCAQNGMRVAVAARNVDKLQSLVNETGAKAYAADATDVEAVKKLVADVERDLGSPDLVCYNASGRVRGPIEELDPIAVQKALMVSAYGGFLVTQQAAIRMLPKGRGTIILTGASASVKGYPNSSSFAMGKFALRGLAQSMARELSPKGIHVVHSIIDGGIGNDAQDRMLKPDSIAATYWHLHKQDRSAWTWEIELRPFVEKF